MPVFSKCFAGAAKESNSHLPSASFIMVDQKLKILSLNVRGLRNPIKHRAVFTYLNKKQISIAYRKRIPISLTKIYGRLNGGETCFFLMVVNTQKASACYKDLIPLYL